MKNTLASKTQNPLKFIKLYGYMRRDSRVLRELLLREKIDIVHTHHHHHHLLSAMACKKDVASVWHMRAIINPYSLYGLQWKIFNYYAARYPHSIIAISNAVRESMAKKVQTKTFVIHNGIDVDRFSPRSSAESKRKLGFDPDVPLVGAVANFIYMKGFHDFISMAAIVAKENRDVNFVLIGPDDRPEDDEYRNARLQQIEQAGLKARFTVTGFLSDPASFMPALDILVIPTVTWEGLGNVVVEAQACGRPVVSTDCGGPSDVIIDGQTGYIVPRRDPRTMSRRVLELLSDKKLAEAMGATGRARATEPRFNIANTVRQVERIYLSMLSK